MAGHRKTKGMGLPQLDIDSGQTPAPKEQSETLRVVLARAGEFAEAAEANTLHAELSLCSVRTSTAPMQSAHVARSRPKASSFGIFNFEVAISSSQPSGSRFSKNGSSPRCV